MIYLCVVDDGRRVIARAQRSIVNVRNGPEVLAALESIVRPLGLKASGHRIRVYETSGRRLQLVQEVTA